MFGLFDHYATGKDLKNRGLPPAPIYCNTGQKYRDRKIIAQWSKGPKPGLGCTLVKSIIWSHDGQKDRFVIFGRGAPKMGKNS